MNQAAIDRAMAKIERAMEKKTPYTWKMDTIRKGLESIYKVAYIHGQTDEKERLKEFLGL